MNDDTEDLTGTAFWLVFAAVLLTGLAFAGVLAWAVIELVQWVTTK